MAKLILEDKTVFEGFSFGANVSTSGEAVFNTGMVGYPEALTDPSYFGQILIFTYPLIGNYGVPPRESRGGLFKYFESEKIQTKGMIISDLSFKYSHWQAKKSLENWLLEENIPGIYGIDTRALTKKLRKEGTMLAKITGDKTDIDFYDPNRENLMSKVSCQNLREYGEGKVKIVLLDCGVKHSIIRSLLERKAKVIRVPYDYDIFKLKFDGLLISNGPGDPKKCQKTIEVVREAMKRKIPIFGICLGNQILALASGADTFKLKYGHRSQNQPCQDLETKKCYVTSQNHGFAVEKSSLPGDWKTWFLNINDGTIEGIKHKEKPFFGVQFHPEASPGPVDTKFLFDKFFEICRKMKKSKKL